MSANLLDRLGELSRYIEIVHHIPGRVRLKFNPAILKELGDEGVKQLENFESVVQGIKEVKVNKMAKSATISYDKQTLTPDFFEQLARGEITPEMRNFLSKEAS